MFDETEIHTLIPFLTYSSFFLPTEYLHIKITFETSFSMKLYLSFPLSTFLNTHSFLELYFENIYLNHLENCLIYIYICE